MRDLGDADSRYKDLRNFRNVKNQKLSKIAFILNDLRRRAGSHVVVLSNDIRNCPLCVMQNCPLPQVDCVG